MHIFYFYFIIIQHGKAECCYYNIINNIITTIKEIFTIYFNFNKYIKN